jgi:hypothetical protein
MEPIKLWNIMLGLAIAALAGLLVFDLAVPKPKAEGTNAQKLESDRLLIAEADKLEKEFEASKLRIAARTWIMSADAVGAVALDRATNMAKKHGLTLGAFRPQKPIEEGELIRLAYVMTLEGPYPGLRAMVRELETPELKLSVHLVQVASADDASDLVNGTIGVTAFLEKPKTASQKK